MFIIIRAQNLPPEPRKEKKVTSGRKFEPNLSVSDLVEKLSKAFVGKNASNDAFFDLETVDQMGEGFNKASAAAKDVAKLGKFSTASWDTYPTKDTPYAGINGFVEFGPFTFLGLTLWENGYFPVYAIVYSDGKTIRAYIPDNGNGFDQFGGSMLAEESKLRIEFSQIASSIMARFNLDKDSAEMKITVRDFESRAASGMAHAGVYKSHPTDLMGYRVGQSLEELRDMNESEDHEDRVEEAFKATYGEVEVEAGHGQDEGQLSMPKLTVDEFRTILSEQLIVPIDLIPPLGKEDIFDYEVDKDGLFRLSMQTLLYALDNHSHQFNRVAFDLENFDSDIHNVSSKLSGIVHHNGYTFLGMQAGGDWEMPVAFILYWTGDRIEAYVPHEGQHYYTGTQKSGKYYEVAYGSESDFLVEDDVPLDEALFPNATDDRWEDKRDENLMFDDVAKRFGLDQ